MRPQRVAFSLACLTIVFEAAGSSVRSADPPAATADRVPADRATSQAERPLTEQAAALAKEHTALERQFYDDLRTHRKDSAKVSELNREYWPKHRKIAEQLANLVRTNLQDPNLLDAVLIMVEDVGYPLDDAITGAVIDRHLAKPAIGRLCFAIRHRGGKPSVERLLTAAAESGQDPTVRGLATFALAESYRNEAMPFSDPPPAALRDKLLAKATVHYQAAADRFALVATPDGKNTLGKIARHELARLRNLPNLKVGGVAPPITGRDVDDQPLALADYRGKVVLLVFWGSWCGPCMAKVPFEKSLSEKYADRPFVLLAVNGGDDRDTAKRTMQKHSMNWRSWWDEGETRGGPIQTEYDIQHWPTVILIDAEGVIRGIDQSDEELTATIEKLLPPQAGSAKAVETK